MIEGKYRFHGHSSLRYVYRNGSMARSRLLTLRYANNPHRVHSRVAVVVSKKVVKAAPKRNRIRRRIFEALRLDWGNIAEHKDLIVNVHSAEFLTIPFEEIQTELSHLLHSAHVYDKQLQAPKEPS